MALHAVIPILRKFQFYFSGERPILAVTEFIDRFFISFRVVVTQKITPFSSVTYYLDLAWTPMFWLEPTVKDPTHG